MHFHFDSMFLARLILSVLMFLFSFFEHHCSIELSTFYINSLKSDNEKFSIFLFTQKPERSCIFLPMPSVNLTHFNLSTIASFFLPYFFEQTKQYFVFFFFCARFVPIIKNCFQKEGAKKQEKGKVSDEWWNGLASLLLGIVYLSLDTSTITVIIIVITIIIKTSISSSSSTDIVS